MTVKRLIQRLIDREKEALETFIDDYSTLILKVITYVLNEPYEKEYIEECYDDVIMIILDKYLKPMPIYTPGELYITGDGVGKGYLNNKELTEKRLY